MENSLQNHFGVVEGFYGRDWSPEDRAACLASCPSLGIANYIYAPKSDRHLRSAWPEPWPAAKHEELAELFRSLDSAGLHCGVGLSPFGLTSLANPRERAALGDKLAQIDALKPHWLGIFFDDMQSTGKTLARAQLEIVEFAASRTDAKKLIVCPSYYSTDKLLEKLFGPRPVHYWRELGAGLDGEIAYFWTGEAVCSETFDRFNLEFIAEQFGRLPTLWDNYPVNDGEKNSQFLRLAPFTGRDRWLVNYIAGHFANPMNQAWSSLLPLATLPGCYGEDSELQEQRWRQAAERFCPGIAGLLWEDCELLQSRGLDHLDENQRARLLDRYRSDASPVARELCDWLNGGYAFDPACLTG